jgi:hypothetical protein
LPLARPSCRSATHLLRLKPLKLGSSCHG